MKKNALEWGVFSVGLLLVLSVIVFLIADSARSDRRSPHISLELGSAEKQGDVWVVPVRAINSGGETAEDVLLRAELQIAGQEPEEAELQLIYLPRGSYREGWFAFENDPSRGELKARAVGYRRP